MAVNVFGPDWFTLKSLKWAMPLPSVRRVSVPANAPVPLPNDRMIAAPVTGRPLVPMACDRLHFSVPDHGLVLELG